MRSVSIRSSFSLFSSSSRGTRRNFSSTHIRMGVTRNVLKAGNGTLPKAGDNITVHCTGILAEGNKKFWSTLDDNKPFAFRVGLGQVIRGWDEGMMQMSVGEEAELTMTGDYAYGPKGFPAWGIPPNATLIFKIQLLKIN
jgi:peptidylprolyl isomerase